MGRGLPASTRGCFTVLSRFAWVCFTSASQKRGISIPRASRYNQKQASLRLVLDGAVEASAEDLAFVRTCCELFDLYKIWEHCFAAAKFPMCFGQ